MSVIMAKPVPPTVRRRNRILLVILLAAALAIAASGVLFLRHYGFPTDETQNSYH